MERAKSQTNLVEKIMLFIPGFRGYKQKEMRRESDRLVRNRIYASLVEAKNEAKEAHRLLVEAKVTEAWNDTDRLVAKLDRAAELVNHAEYGYAGFFNIIKINEPELDRMIDYDLKLLESAENVKKSIKSVREEISSEQLQKSRSRILEAHKVVDGFERVFKQRKDVILGV